MARGFGNLGLRRLTESAKIHGINPRTYLNALRLGSTNEQIKALFPHQIDLAVATPK